MFTRLKNRFSDKPSDSNPNSKSSKDSSNKSKDSHSNEYKTPLSPSLHSSNPSVNSANTASSHSRYLSALREYSILMEYKKLRYLCPTGIYVVPSVDSLRRWHGCIFIRKGYYRSGIFKFILHIPTSYPDLGPRVQFVSEIFHPLINNQTGDLDSSIAFPQWNSQQHYIVLLLCYIKKIFYRTEYWELKSPQDNFNRTAATVWLKNKEEYMKKCEKSCELSIERVFHSEEGSSLKFQKPIQAHQEAFQRIIQYEQDLGEINNEDSTINTYNGQENNETVKALEQKQAQMKKINYIEWFMDGVNRLNEGLPVPGLISPYLERNSALASNNLPLVTPPPVPKTPLAAKLKTMTQTTPNTNKSNRDSTVISATTPSTASKTNPAPIAVVKDDVTQNLFSSNTSNTTQPPDNEKS